MTLTRAGLEWSKRLRKTINQARSGLRERDCSNSQNQLKMSSELGKERKTRVGTLGAAGGTRESTKRQQYKVRYKRQNTTTICLSGLDSAKFK